MMRVSESSTAFLSVSDISLTSFRSCSMSPPVALVIGDMQQEVDQSAIWKQTARGTAGASIGSEWVYDDSKIE